MDYFMCTLCHQCYELTVDKCLVCIIERCISLPLLFVYLNYFHLLRLVDYKTSPIRVAHFPL